MTTQIKFKLFWLWQDEMEEAWLREMAKEGWHLKEVRLLNRYVFEAGTPKDMAYRIDWVTGRRDYQQYLQLFRDAGWEPVTTYGSWQFFRKASVDGVAPEIFTDTDSKMKRYQGILAFLVIFLVVWWNPSLRGLESAAGQEGWLGWVYSIGFILRQVIFVFLLVTVIMLTRRILQLRKKKIA